MKRLKYLLIIFLILLGGIWLYTNSLLGVKDKAKEYLSLLETELIDQGYKAKYFVISGRRWKFDNYLLTKFGGAAKNSKHKRGEAIDIIVLDVNNDEKINGDDVDIVFSILDKKIIRDKGGLGTYKNEPGFFNRQMVHFDCRGKKSRWNR